MNESREPTNELAEEEQSTLSLMGGVAKPEGLPEAADLDLEALNVSRRKISQGTMVIIMVVLIAAGSLYAMRIGQGDLSAGGVPTEVMTKIEAALAKSSPTNSNQAQVHNASMKSAFRDTDTIVNMFNTDVTQSQVPIEYVQKNPFALPIVAQIETNLSADNPGNAVRLKEKQRKLQAAFDKLSLQSVMANARIPVVVIDGQFYKAGQEVGPFTITKIHDRGVDMTSDGIEFALSMQDQVDKKPTRRR